MPQIDTRALPAPAAATASQRIKGALSRRHHVEALALAVILMTIQALLDYHMYAALGIFTIVSIGLRDILVVLLFAEEEGHLR